MPAAPRLPLLVREAIWERAKAFLQTLIAQNKGRLFCWDNVVLSVQTVAHLIPAAGTLLGRCWPQGRAGVPLNPIVEGRLISRQAIMHHDNTLHDRPNRDQHSEIVARKPSKQHKHSICYDHRQLTNAATPLQPATSTSARPATKAFDRRARSRARNTPQDGMLPQSRSEHGPFYFSQAGSTLGGSNMGFRHRQHAGEQHCDSRRGTRKRHEPKSADSIATKPHEA